MSFTLHPAAFENALEVLLEILIQHLYNIMAAHLRRKAYPSSYPSASSMLEEEMIQPRIRSEIYDCTSSESSGKQVGLLFLDSMYGLRMSKHEFYNGGMKITIMVDRRIDTSGNRYIGKLKGYMARTPIQTVWIEEAVAYKSITVSFSRRPRSLGEVHRAPASASNTPIHVNWRHPVVVGPSHGRRYMTTSKVLLPRHLAQRSRKQHKYLLRDVMEECVSHNDQLEHPTSSHSHDSNSAPSFDITPDMIRSNNHDVDEGTVSSEQNNSGAKPPSDLKAPKSSRELGREAVVAEIVKAVNRRFPQKPLYHSKSEMMKWVTVASGRKILRPENCEPIPPFITPSVNTSLDDPKVSPSESPLGGTNTSQTAYDTVNHDGVHDDIDFVSSDDDTSSDSEPEIRASVEHASPNMHTIHEVNTAAKIFENMALEDPVRYGMWADDMALQVAPLLCGCNLDHVLNTKFSPLALAIRKIPSRTFVGKMHSPDEPFHIGSFDTEYLTDDVGDRKIMLRFKTYVETSDPYSDQKAMTGDLVSLMTSWRMTPARDGKGVLLSTPVLRWANGQLHPINQSHTYTIAHANIETRKYSCQ